MLEDNWVSEELPERNERHFLPQLEERLSVHVVSRLCYCKPVKSYPYDVTVYNHRNLTRIEVSNEIIFQKRLAKKVSERLAKEIEAEMLAAKAV